MPVAPAPLEPAEAEALAAACDAAAQETVDQAAELAELLTAVRAEASNAESRRQRSYRAEAEALASRSAVEDHRRAERRAGAPRLPADADVLVAALVAAPGAPSLG